MSDSPLLVNKLEDLFIPEMTTLKGECEVRDLSETG